MEGMLLVSDLRQPSVGALFCSHSIPELTVAEAQHLDVIYKIIVLYQNIFHIVFLNFIPDEVILKPLKMWPVSK